MGSDNSDLIGLLRQIGDRVHSPMPIQRWNCETCGAKSQGAMCSYCGHVTTPAEAKAYSAVGLFAAADAAAAQIVAHGEPRRSQDLAALQAEDPVFYAVVKSRL